MVVQARLRNHPGQDDEDKGVWKDLPSSRLCKMLLIKRVKSALGGLTTVFRLTFDDVEHPCVEIAGNFGPDSME